MGLGPLHYVVITFARDRLGDDAMSELRAVRSRGLVRLVDLLFIAKSRDGVAESVELSDLRGDQVAELSALLGELIAGRAGADPRPAIVRDGVVRGFTDEDVRDLASELPDGSSAAIVLFEHTWARGLAEALDRAGGTILSQAIVNGGRVFHR
jgi:hypothetical protein